MNKLVSASREYLHPHVWAGQLALGKFTLRLSLSRDKGGERAYSPFVPFTNCVQLLRLERDLSRQELACALGIHTSTLYALETGSYLPSLELALRLSGFFDLPIEAIFFSITDEYHQSAHFSLQQRKGDGDE